MERGIRTWILRWFILQCVFCVAVQTIDRGQQIGSRKRKLEELLKTLRNYPTPKARLKPQELKNYTTGMAPLTPSYELTTPLPALPDDSGISEEAEMLNPSSVNSYEDFYRVFYGTEEGLNHLKKHYGPNGLQRARARFSGVRRELEDVRRANEHFLRIRNRARCKVPKARLVRVKDFYPDPSREYLPRCTFLHRCGETSGCCDSDAFHCVPSAMQEVTLHFYTLTVDRNGLGYPTGQNNIRRLKFDNHTACHCQPVNDLPRIVSLDRQSYPLDGTAPKENITPPNTSPHHHRRRHRDHSTKCRECPVPFNSRTYRDGRCGCDCFDRQKPCLRIKRGKEPLAEIERRCVEANYCHRPDCEYGIFDTVSGYCPRRHDETPRRHEVALRRMDSSRRHHRWAFLETD